MMGMTTEDRERTCSFPLDSSTTACSRCTTLLCPNSSASCPPVFPALDLAAMSHDAARANTSAQSA